MCTRGITGEKAIEIQKRWPTPAALVAALDACGSGEAGAKARRDLVFHATAAAVSAKVGEVWGMAEGGGL
jgi:crossover junction endonuclease MUS81